MPGLSWKIREERDASASGNRKDVKAHCPESWWMLHKPEELRADSISVSFTHPDLSSRNKF